jgi:hypothetical protein
MSIFDDIEERERRWLEAAYWARWRRLVILTTLSLAVVLAVALSGRVT